MYTVKRAFLYVLKLAFIINFSDRNKGYDMGLTVRFEDRKSLENYLPHPAHQEILVYLKEIGVEDTIIVDFEIN